MKTCIALALLVTAGCVGDDPGSDVDSDADSDPSPQARLRDDDPAPVVATAFRFTDLDLRDPHIRVRFLGCRDVTDTALLGFSVNGQIQTSMGRDGDGDGYLDFSPVTLFRPLDPAAETSPADSVTGRCTATDPVVCDAGGAEPNATTATNTALGVCLAPLPGTTSNYTPAITRPTDSCFATSEGTLHLVLAGIPITLSNTRIAARYSGDPISGLSSGLLAGFLSEADADSAILPADLPLVGGKPLSSLLAGGRGGCASTSDKDTLDGVSGWWFYLNFTGQLTAWSE